MPKATMQAHAELLPRPVLMHVCMQTCGAAVLSLAGAPQVTHLTLPPHAFYPGMSLVAPHRYVLCCVM